MTYRYRTDILELLIRHGVRPRATTRPAFAKDYVSALYQYELRRLKSELAAGAFPKSDYFARVVEIRRRYPLVSIPSREWAEEIEAQGEG